MTNSLSSPPLSMLTAALEVDSSVKILLFLSSFLIDPVVRIVDLLGQKRVILLEKSSSYEVSSSSQQIMQKSGINFSILSALVFWTGLGKPSGWKLSCVFSNQCFDCDQQTRRF